jgi:hypothetical protein
VAPIAAARASGYGVPVVAAPSPAAEPGWRPILAAAHDEALLEELLRRTAETNGTSLRPLGVTWHLEGHAWYVAAVAVGGLLAHGLMPPLDACELRDGSYGGPECIAVPTEGWEPADGPELAARFAAHLEPLIEALSRGRPRRALWRCAGDRLAQAGLWCGEAFGARERAWALLEAALAAPTPLQAPAGLELVDGAPFRLRSGCCLSYRAPDGVYCPDCRLERKAADRRTATEA